MLIQGVDIENFGILKNVKIDFDTGINLITGDNGEGKSHILKAIALMLISHKGDAPTFGHLCNWDADSFEVGMTLEHDGKVFVVGNSYDKKSNKLARTVKIGEDYFEGKAASDALATFFDPVLCRASILSFQGNLDLVDATPSSRLENLKRIYNLDFSKEAKDIDSQVKITNEQIKKFDVSIGVLENKTYDYQRKLECPWDADDQSVFVKTLEEIEDKISNYQLFESQKTDIQSQIGVLSQKKNEIDRRIHATQSELDEVTEIAEKRHAESEDKIKLIENKSYDEKLNELNDELSSIVLMRPPRNPTDEELENQQVLYDESNRNWSILYQKIEDLKSGICPTCGKPHTAEDLEEDSSLLTAMYVRLNEDKNQLQLLQEERAEFEKVERENERRLQNKKMLEDSIASESSRVEMEKEKDKSEIKMLKQAIKVDHQRIEMVKGSISKDKDRAKELQDEIGNLNSRLVELREKLDKVGLEHLRDRRDEVKEKVETYTMIEQRNSIVDDFNKQLKRQETLDKAELDGLVSTREDLRNHADMLVRGSVILKKEFPNYVIHRLKEGVEFGINDLVDSVYDGRYTVELQQKGSGIEVIYGSNSAPISVASGFEKELFQMGYKNAFAQIADLGVMFLDEVDSYASEGNSKKLFDSLGGVLKERYNQVFIVTHKPSVQDMLITQFGAKAWEVQNGSVQRIA